MSEGNAYGVPEETKEHLTKKWLERRIRTIENIFDMPMQMGAKENRELEEEQRRFKQLLKELEETENKSGSDA